jgi:hypothetical protein
MPKPTDDPLLRLEDRGGAVWAFRQGHGTVLTLSYAGTRDGATVIQGLIRSEDARGARDGLKSEGWRPTESGLEQSWVLHSDLDRSALRRDVHEAIAILAARRGETPDAFPLVHRNPGQTDAGYGQIGCVLAMLSAVVGEVVGIAAILLFQPGRASVHGAVIAFVAAAFIVPWATGDLVPALAGRIGRFRTNAEAVGIVWLLVAPAVAAATTMWLIASIDR